MTKRLFGSLLLTISAVFWTGLAQAQKANVVYFEDAPLPIGRITEAQIRELAASDFTHVIFAFINYCTADDSARGFTCPGPNPGIVWNIKAVHDGNGQPFAAAQAAIATLVSAGKTVYLSVGAAENPETWDYFAGATEAQRAAAAADLQTFMQEYHITGVDFDYEAGASAGFGALAGALVKLDPVPPLSSAPYATAAPAANDPVSTQWQYCEFAKVGAVPTLINRQYYSGGFTPDVVAGIGADLQPFDCTLADGSVKSLTIPASQMSPGIGIPVAASPPNCAIGSAAPFWQDCAAIGAAAVAAFPGLGGMSLWDYDDLQQPAAYACEMANALNGTEKACQ